MPVLQTRIVVTGRVHRSGVVHAQRLEEVVLQVGGERDLGDGLDEASDDVIVHVAVAVLLPGLRLELPSLQSLHTLSQIGSRFDDEGTGQAGSVAEQLADRDVGVPVVGQFELRKVLDDRIVEAHLPGVDELQERE
jgi:hypothetical protein